MKFLCPSCKAKYQIADEKVIGRSVKMKCRQCGHLIEIQESVVGATTATSSLPPAVTPSQVGALLVGKAGVTDPPAAKSATSAAHPATANVKARPAAATGRGLGQKPAEPAVSKAPIHKPLGPAPRIGAKPTAVSPAGSPVAKARPEHTLGTRAIPGATNVRTPRAPVVASKSTNPEPEPTRTKLGTTPEPAPAQSAAPEPVVLPPAASEAAPRTSVVPGAAEALLASLSGPSRKSGEALADAFSTAVGAPASAAAEQSVGDEWYVGVNDNPVGPIPLTELRARATKGEVTIDSLVWRDGFEDWKPLRSFPELLAVVEEAVSSIQATRAPLLPPGPRATTAGAGLVTGGNVQTAVAAGAPAPQQSAAFAPLASAQLSAEELAAATGTRLHHSPKGAWVAVAGALALGLAIGFVFFKQAPAAPEIKYVEVPRTAAPVQSAPVAAASAEVEETPVVASADQIKAAPRRLASNDPKAGPEASAAGSPGAGLKGLSGLRALGPQSGPSETGATPGASGGQALDSATLSKNVSRYTPSVRRSCWQPALDSRAPDAPTTARVSVKIDIAPSGNVSNVSSSGDPRGYRGLASCIESRVRNWTFPVSSGATTVNVPFVFAAQ